MVGTQPGETPSTDLSGALADLSQQNNVWDRLTISPNDRRGEGTSCVQRARRFVAARSQDIHA